MSVSPWAMGGWGDHWVEYAWAGFWQSSLLIAVVWLADLGLRWRVRPVVRHALWLLVLVKLVLPASLSLPTGLGYWIPRGAAVPTGVMEGNWAVREISGSRDGVGVPVLAREPAPVARVAWRLPDLALIAWLGGAAGLLLLVAWHTLRLRRWREATSEVPARLARVLEDVRVEVGLRHPVEVRWIAEGLSPALCGFVRPVLLLPRGLASRLSDERLRAVVLHELVHARRGDVWVNALQVGLQVLWWWHPLVWLANTRLRAVREEVVDDEVAFRMGAQGMAYPEALLEVARATVFRPASGLGFLGIVESRSALRSRVERLLEDPPTRMPRLGWRGGVGILLLGLFLLPMARGRSAAPDRPIEPVHPVGVVTAVEVTPKAGDLDKVDQLISALSPPPPMVLVEARFLELTEEAFRSLPLAGGPGADGVAVDPERVRVLSEAQRRALLEAVSRRSDVRTLGAPRLTTLSGRDAEIRQSGTGTNALSSVMAAVTPWLSANQRDIVMFTRVEWTQGVSEGVLKAGTLPVGRAAQASSAALGATVVTGVQGYVNRSFTNMVVVGDGQAQVLGDLGREAPPFGLRRVLVVLQAMQIDPAGNRVNQPVVE